MRTFNPLTDKQELRDMALSNVVFCTTTTKEVYSSEGIPFLVNIKECRSLTGEKVGE